MVKLVTSFFLISIPVFVFYFSESYGSYVESCQVEVRVLKVFSQDQTDTILKQSKDLSVGSKYVGMRIKVILAKKLRRSHGDCGSIINKERDIVASLDGDKTPPVITAGETLMLNYTLFTSAGPSGGLRSIKWTILETAGSSP